MTVQQLFRTDDRAVSPVLAVALLIAITVILAGVIAFVVLGVDANNADAPQASIDFRQNGTDVTLRHTGGDPLKPGEVNYTIDGVDSGTVDLTTGQTQDITGLTSGEEIVVLWNDPDSDREVLLAEYTVE